MLKSVLCMLLLCICAFAQVDAGTNLILNGDLKDCDGRIPDYWVLNPPEQAEYRPKGGPNGMPCYTILPSKYKLGEFKIRQHDLTLVPGELYKLSAFIKTKDFKPKGHGLVVTNCGWYDAVGIGNFPENTDWTFYESMFKAPATTDVKKYGLVFYAINHSGEVSMADVKLEPLTPAACQGSYYTGFARPVNVPRLVPWQPLLHNIPMDSPKVSFRWYGWLEGKKDVGNYVCQASASTFVWKPVPLVRNELMWFDLKGLGAGEHELTMRVLDKGDGRCVFECKFDIELKSIPVVDREKVGRRLNNLCIELVNRKVKAGEEISFTNPRNGWIYVALKDGAEGSVQIDGKQVIPCKVTGMEAFSFQSVGAHTLKATASGTVILRAITEIFNSSTIEGSRLPQFGAYDWNYFKANAVGAITTFNRGTPSKEILAECAEMGLKWTGSFGATKITTVENMKGRIEGALSKKRVGLAGSSADELFYHSGELDIYTQALKHANYDKDKVMYTWICGSPSLASMHTDFISTCLNASKSCGKLLYEAYCRTRPDEEACMVYFESYMAEPYAAACAMFPNYADGAGIILGNFNQIPVISLEHSPEVDYKYYLDMQVNYLANEPVFKDLGTTGYWGTHYSDEEMFRWSFALMRHYVVEGKREMLSKQYGFSYKPGHLVNGDFADGLKGWTAQGNISTGSVPNFGAYIQDRWGGNDGQGDTYCLFTRKEGEESKVTQVAKGLIPGRKYMLQFVVGDLKDIKAARHNPRRLGLDVELTGADIQKDGTFVFVDERIKGNYASSTGVARINLHRIIFTAKAKDITLTFTDKAALAGEELVMNYVQLKPFFDKK